MSQRKLAFSVLLAAVLLGGLVVLLVTSLSENRGREEAAGVAAKIASPASRAASPAVSAGAPASGAGAAAPEAPQVAADSAAPPATDTRPVSIEGRVTDAQGQGIAGTRIVAVERAGWEERIRAHRGRLEKNPFEALGSLQTGLTELAGRLPSTATGDDGRYELRGLAEGDHRVVATRDGYLPHGEESWVLVEPDRIARYDVCLVLGHRISGGIVDADGKPVAAAAVRAQPTEIAGLRGMGKLLHTLGAQSEAGMLTDTARTETDAAGAFLLGSLEPRLYDVHVEKDGFAWADVKKVPAGVEGLAIVLPPAPRILGRVLDAGKQAIAGAQVVLREGEKDMRKLEQNPLAMMSFDFDLLGEKTRRATASESGDFALDAFKVGQYEIVIEMAGFATHRATVKVEGPGVNLGDIVLEQVQSISGRVVGPDGRAVAGASVFVPKPAGSSPRPGLALPRVPDPENGVLDLASSDETGAFELTRLPPGSHDVAATAAGLLGTVRGKVAAGARGLTLALEAGETVSGTIVDALDRTPVAGAIVQAGFRSHHRATSGVDGSFVLSGIDRLTDDPSGSQIYIRVEHDQYEQLFRGLTPSAEGSPVTLELRRSQSVGGVVLDPDGRPLRGARVWLEIPGMPPAILKMAATGGSGMELSDERGAFTLTVPRMGPSSSFEIVAVYPGFAKARHELSVSGQESDARTVEIRLAAGTVLEGRVSDPSGVPVVGAQVGARRNVKLSGESLIFAAMLPPSAAETVYSSDDGAYRISGLEPGNYKLAVSAVGFARKEVSPVEIGTGPTRLDVSLDAGGSVAGRVVDPQRSPLAGVEVVALLELEARTDHAREQRGEGENFPDELALMGSMGAAAARTDEAGRYELTHLPEGKFRIVARAAQHVPAETRDVEAGQAVADLVLEPLARLRGRASDAATGEPLSAYQLSLAVRNENQDWRESYRQRRQVADSEGRFEYEEIRSGQYRLTVRGAGFAPAVREVEVAPGGSVEVDIEVERGARVEGAVYSADSGAPIAGASIQLRSDTHSDEYNYEYNRNRQTAADGRFELAGLAEGDFTVSVSHPDYYMESDQPPLRFHAPPAEGLVLEATMQSAGRIEGQVRDLAPQDRKTSSYELVLRRQSDAGPAADSASAATGSAAPNGEYRAGAWLDEEGRFKATSLKPGTYQVELTLQTWNPGNNGAALQRSEPQPLGAVEIRAGETARFAASAK